jgi:hypothetical protein
MASAEVFYLEHTCCLHQSHDPRHTYIHTYTHQCISRDWRDQASTEEEEANPSVEIRFAATDLLWQAREAKLVNPKAKHA